MGPMQSGLISFLLLQMLSALSGIRITDAPPTNAAEVHGDGSAAINYRVSAPKPKQSSNRVPSYQQDIRVGYVDDDADDVIHIIEPPQYFELLKMLAQQRMLPAKGTKQQKLTIDAPKKIAIRDQTHQSSDVAAIKTPPKYMKKPVFRPPNGLPLELLASVRQHQRVIHNAGRPIAMPLARERIKSQKLQTVFIEQGYAQKQFERGQQLQLGAVRSGVGQVRRKQRVRRDAEKSLETNKRREEKSKKASSIHKSSKTKKVNKSRAAVKPRTKQFKTKSPGLVARRRLEAKNQSNKLMKGRKAAVKRRPKREVQQNEFKKAEIYQKNVLLKGNELMDHLTALLKKATYYLPDSPDAENSTELEAETTSKREAMQNVLAQKWQHEIRPAELIGEIVPTQRTTEMEVKPNELLLLQEEQVNKKLMNSWNVTNVIMDNLIKQKNFTVNEDEPQHNGRNDNCRQSNESYAMEKLQQRIDCMRQQLYKEASNSTAMRLRKRFGELVREKKINVSLADATKPAKRKIRKQRKQKQQQQTQGTSNFRYSSRIASFKQAPTIDNLSLLYEDVMTNIRNLLQAKNLQELEDELVQRTLSRKQQLAAEDESSPRFATPRQLIEDASDTTDYGEFNHLNKYLNELQQIVSDFVHPVRSSSKVNTTGLSLNTREYAGSSTTTPLSATQPDSADNWYLINDNGRIYQTHLAAELRPSIAVFHRFPDIPNAPFYLQNRTQLAEQPASVIEIL